MRRYRDVPSLQFLQGFEAAARLGSFAKAAEELGLSQSAISHEMRLLEERIGQPLFMRIGRSVRLTDAGLAYQRAVREALDGLNSAQKRLEPFRRKSSVVIYAPRDFGRRWLLPHLGNLRSACPEIQPWVDTSGMPIDFNSMEMSIGIVYAQMPPADCLFVKLAEDIKAPMVAAGSDLVEIKDVAALAQLPLIHDEKMPGWAHFFEANGYEGTIHPSGLDFSDSDAALQAAEYGLGVILGSLLLAQDSLASSRLVTFTESTLHSLHSWFAITTEKEIANPHTLAVWNWLVAIK